MEDFVANTKTDEIGKNNILKQDIDQSSNDQLEMIKKDIIGHNLMYETPFG